MATKIRKLVPIPVNGLDFSKPGEYLDYRSTSNCQNIDIRRGLITKRPGGVALGSALSSRVQALFDFDDGQATNFVRIGNTQAEEYNQTTDAWASILSSPLTGSDDDRVSFAFPLLTGSRIAVFTNGVDNIKKWTGSGNCADLGGSPPKARFVLDFSGYLLLGYIISGGTFFTRIQWCDTGNIENWSSGDAGSVDLLEDSDDMTGLARFDTRVTVHKNRSIYVGYLTNTSAVFRFDRKATGAGTVANSSIMTLPTGEQAFLASDGIRLFNGVTAPTIESPVMDELRDYMNPEHIRKACATIKRDLDEYWVGVPIGSQTEPETVYKFNYLTRQCYKDRRPLLVAMGEYRNTTNADWDSDSEPWDTDTTDWDAIQDLSLNPVVAFGHSDGTVFKRDASASDNGEAIEAFWDSKDFVAEDYGAPEGSFMRWTEVPIICKGQSVTLQYSTNGGTTWTSAGTFDLSSDFPDDTDTPIAYIDVIAKRCRFRFMNYEVDETFAMKQFFPTAIPQGYY